MKRKLPTIWYSQRTKSERVERRGNIKFQQTKIYLFTYRVVHLSIFSNCDDAKIIFCSTRMVSRRPVTGENIFFKVIPFRKTFQGINIFFPHNHIIFSLHRVAGKIHVQTSEERDLENLNFRILLRINLYPSKSQTLVKT